MTPERRTDPSRDDYCVEHVRDALAHDAATMELDVQVTVTGRRLVLTGYAGTEEHRQAITDVAQRVAPDFDVMNEMDLADFGADGEAESLS
jgi:osmotically-inducible protein OsmY